MKFNYPPNEVEEPVQKLLDRAIQDAIRRENEYVMPVHVLAVILETERSVFEKSLFDSRCTVDELCNDLEKYISRLPTKPTAELKIYPHVYLIIGEALTLAKKEGREAIGMKNMIVALLSDKLEFTQIFLNRNIALDRLINNITAVMERDELADEIFRKKFELPPFLKQFATNLNLLARQGKISPLCGRDKELAQVLEILSIKDRSNSVILVGESGVGKTALAEGLAFKIECDPNSVPKRLQDSQIINLQMNALVSGTMLRGMFEDRLQNVIREVRERPHYIIFVDEAHTMIGAGSALGAPSDAAQILKSHLQKGEIRMIGATTSGEYKEYFQNDEALSRRFRMVRVEEPTMEETKHILFKSRPTIEKNYSVQIVGGAVDLALKMSPLYIRHLRRPGKPLAWLDTAAVRAEIDGRKIVHPDDIVRVIASDAQIPEDMVFRDVTARFKDLDEVLSHRVIGQKDAKMAIKDCLMVNKGPFKENPDRPDGVLLFLGPTGVGKTELAKSLAEFLFGDEKRMIRIDMSEYQDGSSAYKLVGPPRGISGAESGGILTNQLLDYPYSVVLLDEIEKAHPLIYNLLLTAFDEGWITDGRGRRAYLSDAFIIMTSNLGAEEFKKLDHPMGFNNGQVDISQIVGGIRKETERRFSPEFRNRLDKVVIFEPLTREEIETIVMKKIVGLKELMTAEGKILLLEPETLVVETIARKGYSLAYGARYLNRFIKDNLITPISRNIDKKVFYVYVVNGEIVVKANGIESEAGV